MDGKSVKAVRRMAQDVRRELRLMAGMMEQGDWEWALIHAQQAAASAAQVEELVRLGLVRMEHADELARVILTAEQGFVEAER